MLFFTLLSFFFFYCSGDHRDLHSFPTRRSSDLIPIESFTGGDWLRSLAWAAVAAQASERRDRKSTRLNSSHRTISYAVFCLKKKKQSLDRVWVLPKTYN